MKKFRQEVRERFFKLEHQPDRDEWSQHGPYQVKSEKWVDPNQQYSVWSRLVVFGGEDQIITEILSVGRVEHYSVILNHPDGHDYLFRRENRSSITVVQLDTGDDHLHMLPDGEHNRNWIWFHMFPSPCKTRMAVKGCHRYDIDLVRVYDISDPMVSLPCMFESYNEPDIQGWDDDSTLRYGQSYDWCTLTNQSEWDMSLEDLEEASRLAKEAGIENEDDIWEERFDLKTWNERSFYESRKD